LARDTDPAHANGSRNAAPQASARSPKGENSRTGGVGVRGGSRPGGWFSIERVHAAASLKLDAAVDEKRRRVQVADHLARGIELDRRSRADVSMNDPAPHDDRGH